MAVVVMMLLLFLRFEARLGGERRLIHGVERLVTGDTTLDASCQVTTIQPVTRNEPFRSSLPLAQKRPPMADGRRKQCSKGTDRQGREEGWRWFDQESSWCSLSFFDVATQADGPKNGKNGNRSGLHNGKLPGDWPRCTRTIFLVGYFRKVE
jgi:hypothetical protein